MAAVRGAVPKEVERRARERASSSSAPARRQRSGDGGFLGRAARFFLGRRVFEAGFVVAVLAAVIALAVWFGFAVFLASATGCGSARNEVRGGTTSIKHSTVEEYAAPDPKACPDQVEAALTKRTVTSEATSTGASARQSGTEIDHSISGAPARLELPGLGTAEGGGFDAEASVIGGIPVVPVLAGLAGVLAWCGAGYLVYRQRIREACIAAVVGAAFFAIAVWPWLIPLGCVLAAVGLVAWIVASHGRHRFKEAARSVIEAVETAPVESAAPIKAWMGEHAEAADRRVLDALKYQDYGR